MPDSDFLLTVSSTIGHKGFNSTGSQHGDPVLEGKGSLEVIWLNPTAVQAGPLRAGCPGQCRDNFEYLQ